MQQIWKIHDNHGCIIKDVLGIAIGESPREFDVKLSTAVKNGTVGDHYC